MASSKKAKAKVTKSPLSFTTGVGIGLVLLSLYLFTRLFRDPIQQEIKYSLRQTVDSAQISPINTDFSLVVDKIGANAAIVPQVNPNNSREYQVALKSGIAHAKGSALPGQGQNIFLFAHSSADLLTAERYNSVFYLMHHLVAGDTIKLWYQGSEYVYIVSEKKIVAPTDIQYLGSESPDEQLTLMTCWPAGTTLRRLIVIAKPL
jgi:LPXTG-site transpeptidase (sortase) family protein